MATSAGMGNNGVFIFQLLRNELRAIASDGAGWEHVSVSLIDRCPTWDEMCVVKAIFWDAEDCVVQYHPPQSDYVNCHPYCLHLWRPVGASVPRPPKFLVGG
ncbi:hypothetical protein DF159_20875 [Burkholderia ubonensis]|nr:hypothetical protein DF159_20875 [Burkholderia ubonensis]